MNWEDKFKDNLLEVLYRVDQPRDERGRWTSGGSAPPGTNDKVYDWALNKFGDPDTARNFTEWFGDSKVVDADGNPQVVYHGTTADFDEFAKIGISTEHPSSALGFYFTESPYVADEFNRDWSEVDEHLFPPPARTLPHKEGASVMPTYLSITNPKQLSADEFRDLFVDDNFKLRTPDGFRELREEWQAQGHDGIIIERHIAHVPPPGLEEYRAPQYVTFNPTQIKSATGNKGTFDPNNPNITLIIKSDKKP